MCSHCVTGQSPATSHPPPPGLDVTRVKKQGRFVLKVWKSTAGPPSSRRLGGGEGWSGGRKNLRPQPGAGDQGQPRVRGDGNLMAQQEDRDSETAPFPQQEAQPQHHAFDTHTLFLPHQGCALQARVTPTLTRLWRSTTSQRVREQSHTGLRRPAGPQFVHSQSGSNVPPPTCSGPGSKGLMDTNVKSTKQEHRPGGRCSGLGTPRFSTPGFGGGLSFLQPPVLCVWPGEAERHQSKGHQVSKSPRGQAGEGDPLLT